MVRPERVASNPPHAVRVPVVHDEPPERNTTSSVIIAASESVLFALIART